MVAAIVVGVVVASVAVTPLVEPLVDWGMDSDLSPGVWEIRHWLGGALITTLFAGFVGVPVMLISLVGSYVLCGRGALLHGDGCPECGSVEYVAPDHCPACGPLPPRHPGRSRGDGLRIAMTTLAGIAIAAVVVIVLSTGISWVRLEREEDAFGERARAAAANGADSHQETTAHGSILGWRAEDGYWSHRD